jgi:signal transduction histidine kinase
VISYMLLLIPPLVGRLVRARAVRVQTLQIEVADHARKRDELARAAIAAERARIARELHDVIAHSVSVVIVQAVATLGELDDQRFPAARARVTAIEETARQALADMRRLVAIGDEGTAPGELGPQPGVETLPALVAGVADAGVDATLEVSGTARPVPAGVGLTLYRVAQEALTNAVNHAPGATVTVRVHYRDAAVDLEVVNGAPTAADTSTQGGNGLVGMRERTALYGGTLGAGPNGDGGFSVRASLPLEAAFT